MASTVANRIQSAFENSNYDKLLHESGDKIAEYVEEYPISTVLMALSGGLIIGAVATLCLTSKARRNCRR